jgi:hypothetical protein
MVNDRFSVKWRKELPTPPKPLTKINTLILNPFDGAFFVLGFVVIESKKAQANKS